VIRFSNPFLAVLGIGFWLLSNYTNSLVSSFMFGVCFGFIYHNYKLDKEENNK